MQVLETCARSCGLVSPIEKSSWKRTTFTKPSHKPANFFRRDWNNTCWAVMLNLPCRHTSVMSSWLCGFLQVHNLLAAISPSSRCRSFNCSYNSWGAGALWASEHTVVAQFAVGETLWPAHSAYSCNSQCAICSQRVFYQNPPPATALMTLSTAFY